MIPCVAAKFKYPFNKLKILLAVNISMVDIDYAVTIKK